MNTFFSFLIFAIVISIILAVLLTSRNGEPTSSIEKVVDVNFDGYRNAWVIRTESGKVIETYTNNVMKGDTIKLDIYKNYLGFNCGISCYEVEVVTK